MLALPIILGAPLLIAFVTIGPATAVAQTSEIVFTRGAIYQIGGNDREVQDIYVMDDGGNLLQRLTTSPTGMEHDSSEPAWSSDRAQIVFMSMRERSNTGNTAEIYVMDAVDNNGDGQGDNLVRLTTNIADDQDPTWSPDDTRIAFASYMHKPDGSEGAEIYAMDPADTDSDGQGDNLVRLTHNTFDDYAPVWSPDGTKIAFVRQILSSSNREIFLIDSDGSNEVRLTNASGTDWSPSWAPDSTRIVFGSNRHDPSSSMEIYVMDAIDSDQDGNGDNLVRLTTTPSSVLDNHPVWSPDGTKIAFTTNRTGNFDIWVMDATGANPISLTNHPLNEFMSDWR